jgi:hypothetical protein
MLMSLGFGYNSDNLKRLEESAEHADVVAGTALALTGQEKGSIKFMLRRSFGRTHSEENPVATDFQLGDSGNKILPFLRETGLLERVIDW